MSRPFPAQRLRRLGVCALLALPCALFLSGLVGAGALGSALAGTGPAPTQARLAYVTGGARSPTPVVWALPAGAGAAPVRLGPGGQPLLSPNGQLVAASLADLPGGPPLAVYHVGGAPATSFASLAGVTAVPLAWSPDSKYLAVALLSTSVRDIAAGSSLVVLDLETGALTTVAHGWVQGASFAPEGSDRLAYGLASSLALEGRVDVYTSAPDGSGVERITRDGRSLNPVWGASGIAFDRERLRRDYAPIYQIWLASPSGAHARQLTHVHVQLLVSGLVPLAFSAAGTRLVAEFVGEDTSAAWTVQVGSGRARELRAGEHSLQAAGISADGSTVLIDEDSFENPPSSGRIVAMPFAGGPVRVLVAHGGQASWSE
jgi:Tol biopolymer transport system component